jgi:peptidoglycan/LPS O-acetylase OafA/YrhL
VTSTSNSTNECRSPILLDGQVPPVEELSSLRSVRVATGRAGTPSCIGYVAQFVNGSIRRTARTPERVTQQPRQSKIGAFRSDIEGLRGIAVLAGILYHSGLAVSGGYVGVDVFYVISGFLITRYLYSELAGSGRISLARFYARRVRRILPVATLVIVVTLIATWALVSPLEIHSAGLGAITAALFCINYRLAENGTNYFADTSFSPFQQYWSLAIEEQFYALWPLLLLGVTWLTRRLLSSRQAMSSFLVVVVAVSLFASVAQTPSSPSWAYFGLQTRAWELALGALVALNADWLTEKLRSVAATLSWLGLGAIVATAMLYNGHTSYPGYAVVIPVAGAACVIAAGGASPRRGAEAFLGLRALQYIGRISYSWYLWHWPILVFLPYAVGHRATTGLVILALIVSFAIASASYEIVERPFRQNKNLVTYPHRGLLLGAALVGISLVTAVLVMNFVVLPTGSGPPEAVTRSAGRNVVLATHLRVLPSDLSPPLAEAANDYPPVSCLGGSSVGSIFPQATCVFGDTAASRTVVLFGDSHAWQWIPALSAIASERGWKLVIYTKEACSAEDVTNPSVSDAESSNCGQWRNAVFARLASLRPALVVMSSWVLDSGSSGPEMFAANMTTTIAKLKADGSKVVYIEDTPTPGFSVLDCLSTNTSDVQQCSYSLTTGLTDPATRTAVNQAAAQDAALVIDPIPWLCTTAVCPPIIENTVVYFDKTHLSRSFTLTLVPELAAALSSVMPGTP